MANIISKTQAVPQSQAANIWFTDIKRIPSHTKKKKNSFAKIQTLRKQKKKKNWRDSWIATMPYHIKKLDDCLFFRI